MRARNISSLQKGAIVLMLTPAALLSQILSRALHYHAQGWLISTLGIVACILIEVC
jgi:hypothetical protein